MSHMSRPTPRELIDELDRLEAMRDPSQATKSQRMFDRQNVRTLGQLQAISRNRLQRTAPEVQIRDCSLGGLGFVTSEPADVGSVWSILLYQDGFVVTETVVIVRHCSRVGPGLYLCGAQFCAAPGLMSLMGCHEQFMRSQYNSDHGTELGAFLSPEDLGLGEPDAA